MKNAVPLPHRFQILLFPAKVAEWSVGGSRLIQKRNTKQNSFEITKFGIEAGRLALQR